MGNEIVPDFSKVLRKSNMELLETFHGYGEYRFATCGKHPPKLQQLFVGTRGSTKWVDVAVVEVSEEEYFGLDE